MKKTYLVLTLSVLFAAAATMQACQTEALTALGNTIGRFPNGAELTNILQKSDKNYSFEEILRIQAAFLAVNYGKFTPGHSYASHSHTTLLTEYDLGMPYRKFMEVFPTSVWPQVVPILPAERDGDMYDALKAAYASGDHPKMRPAAMSILGAYKDTKAPRST